MKKKIFPCFGVCYVMEINRLSFCAIQIKKHIPYYKLLVIIKLITLTGFQVESFNWGESFLKKLQLASTLNREFSTTFLHFFPTTFFSTAKNCARASERVEVSTSLA